jgi:WD40 repeat protein
MHIWGGDVNHPERQILATGSEDRTVKIWDALTGECIQTLQGHRDRVWLVLFSPDGSTLLSASENQTVKLWDVRTGQCLRTLEGYSNSVLSVALSSDGQLLASSGRDQLLRLWDVATGDCIKTCRDILTSSHLSRLHRNWMRVKSWQVEVTIAPSRFGIATRENV